MGVGRGRSGEAAQLDCLFAGAVTLFDLLDLEARALSLPGPGQHPGILVPAPVVVMALPDGVRRRTSGRMWCADSIPCG
jgi:hypothetical protein